MKCRDSLQQSLRSDLGVLIIHLGRSGFLRLRNSTFTAVTPVFDCQPRAPRSRKAAQRPRGCESIRGRRYVEVCDTQSCDTVRAFAPQLESTPCGKCQCRSLRSLTCYRCASRLCSDLHNMLNARTDRSGLTILYGSQTGNAKVRLELTLNCEVASTTSQICRKLCKLCRMSLSGLEGRVNGGIVSRVSWQWMPSLLASCHRSTM